MGVAGTLEGADKSRIAFNRGREEEARQGYEEAYADYQVAYSLQPGNIEYRSAATRVRFLAAAAKVHRGLLLREAGDSDAALLQFEAAQSIDPSSFIARQEIEITRRLMSSRGSSPKPNDSEPATNGELEKVAGPIRLAPVSQIPITLKISEDSRLIYETVAKLAGINVLFDPDYTGRRIHVELNGVTLEQSLEVIALETKTFWRPVTGNTIFVATDNPAKRKELEQSVIRTFYLANLTQPTELQDTVNAIRTILEVSRIQQLPAMQAIIVRGTPDQVLLAEKVIDDLDKAPPEVVVEFAIMQVNRDAMKNLGINPPTSATVQLQNNTSNTSSTSSSSSSSSSSTSSSNSSSNNSLNLNRLANLDATDFTVTIPSASANALLSDSATKIIQNPQLRSVNGQKATLKIGDRVPTATGSFSSGVGSVGTSALVNTQFQYIDVGVNVDITPHVEASGEIDLKMSLDVSSVTSYDNIGGLSQPDIGQRKVEHEIRLRDGEVSLLGGILEEQDIKSISGIPGLSQIPFLKYLFSETSKEKKNNEIVFAVIPRIVRKRELSPLNQRTLDVGTSNGIQVRRVTEHSDKPEPSEGALQKTMPRSGQDAGLLHLTVDPEPAAATAGSTVSVSVRVSGAHDLHSMPLNIAYDAARLQLINVSNGDLLSQGGEVVALVHRDDPQAGLLRLETSRPPRSGGAAGGGVITILTFETKTAGSAFITVTDARAVDSSGAETPLSLATATVVVQ